MTNNERMLELETVLRKIHVKASLEYQRGFDVGYQWIVDTIEIALREPSVVSLAPIESSQS